MYLPTYVCASVKSNVLSVAPVISEKLELSVDDCHWYVNARVPSSSSTSVIPLVSAVSVWPSANVPLTANVPSASSSTLVT